jgi:hypothetical protein
MASNNFIFIHLSKFLRFRQNDIDKKTNRSRWLRELGKRDVSYSCHFILRDRNLKFRAAHIGEKVQELKNEYNERILMWCKEEELDDGRKLSEVINKEHENVKYLPGHKLPENVIALPDLCEAVKDADILIFVIPHQYVKKTCEELKGKIKKDAFALTLIKVRRKKNQFEFILNRIFRDFMLMKKATN